MITHNDDNNDFVSNNNNNRNLDYTCMLVQVDSVGAAEMHQMSKWEVNFRLANGNCPNKALACRLLSAAEFRAKYRFYGNHKERDSKRVKSKRRSINLDKGRSNTRLSPKA